MALKWFRIIKEHSLLRNLGLTTVKVTKYNLL